MHFIKLCSLILTISAICSTNVFGYTMENIYEHAGKFSWLYSSDPYFDGSHDRALDFGDEIYVLGRDKNMSSYLEDFETISLIRKKNKNEYHNKYIDNVVFIEDDLNGISLMLMQFQVKHSTNPNNVHYIFVELNTQENGPLKGMTVASFYRANLRMEWELHIKDMGMLDLSNFQRYRRFFIPLERFNLNNKDDIHVEGFGFTNTNRQNNVLANYTEMRKEKHTRIAKENERPNRLMKWRVDLIPFIYDLRVKEMCKKMKGASVLSKFLGQALTRTWSLNNDNVKRMTVKNSPTECHVSISFAEISIGVGEIDFGECTSGKCKIKYILRCSSESNLFAYECTKGLPGWESAVIEVNGDSANLIGLE